MRWLAAALLALLAGLPAFAQNDGTMVVPPAPAIISAPPAPATPPPSYAPPPPGLVQNQLPDSIPALTGSAGNSGETGPSATGNAAAAPPDVAPAMPNTWLPGNSATLGVLDKVGGGVSQAVIPVGGQAKLGDLQVSVESCVHRPPGQIPDAAVFLSIQGKQASAAPLFQGWIVRSAPAAAVAGDSSESFRVIGCT